MMMMLMRVPVKWASAARHSGKKLLPGIWWKTAKKRIITLITTPTMHAERLHGNYNAYCPPRDDDDADQ